MRLPALTFATAIAISVTVVVASPASAQPVVPDAHQPPNGT